MCKIYQISELIERIPDTFSPEQLAWMEKMTEAFSKDLVMPTLPAHVVEFVGKPELLGEFEAIRDSAFKAALNQEYEDAAQFFMGLRRG